MDSRRRVSPQRWQPCHLTPVTVMAGLTSQIEVGKDVRVSLRLSRCRFSQGPCNGHSERTAMMEQGTLTKLVAASRSLFFCYCLSVHRFLPITFRLTCNANLAVLRLIPSDTRCATFSSKFILAKVESMVPDIAVVQITRASGSSASSPGLSRRLHTRWPRTTCAVDVYSLLRSVIQM